MTELTKEIEEEVLSQFRNNGWPHAKLYLESKEFSYEVIELIRKRLYEGKSLCFEKNDNGS